LIRVQASLLKANVPKSDRTGWVFRPLNKAGSPLARTGWAVGDAIEAIAKKAGVIVGVREKFDGKGKPYLVKEYASAHDLRRAFGTRWARRAMPTVLRELMRHASIDTTMPYYVGQNAEATAESLWDCLGNKPSNSKQNHSPASATEGGVSPC